MCMNEAWWRGLLQVEITRHKPTQTYFALSCAIHDPHPQDLQDSGCVARSIKYGVMLYGKVRGAAWGVLVQCTGHIWKQGGDAACLCCPC